MLIGYYEPLWPGPARVPSPEEGVLPGAIIVEVHQQHCQVIHCIHIT